jgi:hypothetical protein
MKSRSPAAAIVAGALVVAALCTVVVDHGWYIWPPLLLAILVVAALKAKLNL